MRSTVRVAKGFHFPSQLPPLMGATLTAFEPSKTLLKIREGKKKNFYRQSLLSEPWENWLYGGHLRKLSFDIWYVNTTIPCNWVYISSSYLPS